SRNGGGSYETLFASIANTGSVSWTVTAPATGQALIKVSSVETPSVSDTSDAPFILRQPPTGAPVITSITPGLVTTPIGNFPSFRMGFVNENVTTRLTVAGSNLNAATVSVPASQQPSCAPTIRIVSVDPAGQTMHLDVYVPSNLCFLYSQYTSTNYVPTAIINSYGYMPFEISVVPERLKISAYTPATAHPGSIYMVSVVGYNMAGATLTSDDPSRLQITDVSIRQIEGAPLPLYVINGLGHIAADASGQVMLRVSGPRGTETEPVVIDSQPDDAPATADGLQTFTVAADLATPVYFQTPTVLDELADQPAGTNQGGVAFGARLDPFHWRWFASLISCRGTVCPPLNNFPMTPVSITGFVLGVSVDVSLEFELRVFPAASGQGVDFSVHICARTSGWVGIIGGPAAAFNAGRCYGSPPSISQSQISGMRYDSTGCLEVSDLFQYTGFLNGTVRATGCCNSTLRLNFSSFTTPDGRGALPDQITIVPWEVRLTSFRPELTRVEFSPGEVQEEPGGAAVTVLLRAYVKIPGTGADGQNVTVRVNRDAVRSSACISSSATPVSLTQFVPANGVEVPFVFTVQLSVPSSCPLPGVLIYKAELSLNAGVNYFTCTAAGVEPSATLLVSRTAPPPVSVSIEPFVGVCKDGQIGATIRATGASHTTANLTLERIAGSMGEARFAANNMTTLNNVTISSAGTTVAIKGITPSDLADNLELRAILTSGQQASSERFSVLSVEVVEVDVCADVIRTQVYPSQVNGTFTLRITRAGGQPPVVVVNRQTRAGGAGYEDRINIDNANTYPAGTYQAVEAIWNVGGVECRNIFARFPMPFTILGDNWRITCYNTPLETDFTGPTVNVCTSSLVNQQCQWTPSPGPSFIRGFLDEVAENGSGQAATGQIITLEFICQQHNPPACSRYIDRGGRLRRYRMPSEIRGSSACGGRFVTPNFSVAMSPGNPNFQCGSDQVCIRPVQQVSGMSFSHAFQVEDTGSGLSSTQLDVYRGSGTQACANWPNPMARVVRLGR
ncbi:MAG: hypothetical protein QXD59_02105, partial [Candidatus Caldarchaeum sp.]